MQDAHDIVAGFLVDGNAGVPGANNDSCHLCHGYVMRYAVDIGAWNHGVLHLQVVEPQNAEQHGLLFGFHLAFGARFKNGFFQRFLIIVPEQLAQARPDGTMTFRTTVQCSLLGWEWDLAAQLPVGHVCRAVYPRLPMLLCGLAAGVCSAAPDAACCTSLELLKQLALLHIQIHDPLGYG